MKPINSKVVVETSGLTEQVSFSAKTENLGVLFHILRNQLYSNPVLAVIREYTTNARDAHAAAGKPKKPIQVTLPNALEAFFKVRDFGKGLDADGIKEIFSSYGESTKRNTNTQTGMLGIGCKSAFAYTDSFVVNSFIDGKMQSWSAFLDPSQQGKMALMAEDVTSEPDGLEIVIAVKSPDINKFRTEALNFFTYFDILPEFKNVDTNELTAFNTKRDAVGLYSVDGWKMLATSNSYSTPESVAVMGNIPYPINAEILGNALKPEVREILKAGLMVNFKTGDLEFAASREALQYTDHTKKKLAARLNGISDEILAEAKKEFSKCTTLWEARCLHHEIFSSNGRLYALRSFFSVKNMDFKGHPISSTPFTTRTRGTVCARYHENYNRVNRESAGEIPARKGVMVVENSTKICNLIVNRIAPVLKDKKATEVYLIKFENPQDKADWLTATNYDGPIVTLESLPKKNLVDCYPSMVMLKMDFNKKHSAKAFELDTTQVIGNTRSYTSSDYWTEAKIKADTATGIFIEIERFEVKEFFSYWKNPRELRGLLSDLQSLGITIPTIYGFKRNTAAIARTNKNMKPFMAWVREVIEAHCKANPQQEQEFVNREHFNKWIQDSHRDLTDFARMCLKWNHFPQNDLRKFFQNYISERKKLDNVAYPALQRCMDLISYKPALPSTMSLEGAYKAQVDKYPLLLLTAQMVGTHNMYYQNTKMQDASIEYINMVDAKFASAVAPALLVLPAPAPVTTQVV